MQLNLINVNLNIMNISLTWLILLFHAACVYSPYLPYYVKEPTIPSEPGPESLSWYALVFIIFMNAWNMPFFFFLSGVSTVFSLEKYVTD